MSDTEFLREAAPATAICCVLILLYATSGLMAVVVAAALFDIALRAVSRRTDRRARAAVHREPGGPT